MRFRAIIFDDDQQIRDLLEQILALRGYEVRSFADPTFCSFHIEAACQCTLTEACADFIISDMNMMVVRGLDFLENQLKKGCKIRRMALISGSWTESELKAADRIGCKTFRKPFTLDEINQWLDACEKENSPERHLKHWA